MATKLLVLVPLFVQTIAAYSGVATFNNYAAQSNTVCGPKSGQSGTYGVAIGDLSPNAWSGARCSGSIDYSKCNGQNPVAGYVPPSCPKTTCGECFKICNAGGYGGASVGGVGNCIIAQVIDACPSESAQNYCKTNVPADERCGSSSTNSFDLDISAYRALTGVSWSSGQPNLKINVSPSSC